MFKLDNIYGFKELTATFKHLDSDRAECIEYDRRFHMKAYAINNDKEYLAELSEAYFSRNDYYPYTHEDLKEHDIVGTG